ncbi:unnamed protein product [Caretta caretta]
MEPPTHYASPEPRNVITSLQAGNQEPRVSNDRPSHILCGGMVVEPNVKEFTGTSAILEDGTVEEKVDIAIFTTGHHSSLPLLEETTTPGLTV